MKLPEFYSNAPRLRMYDPLADLLGSAEDGILEYDYADAVRLSGHSCPAVAGAWLMVSAGLSWLYEDGHPRRGDIEVHLRDSIDQGVTGVIAAIATLVCGAAQNGGFGGIGKSQLHKRRGLLHFEASIDGTIGLRRRDTGAGVVLDINTDHVPHDPEVFKLMPQVIKNLASVSSRQEFRERWQDRVRRLFEMADDPQLVHIYDWA